MKVLFSPEVRAYFDDLETILYEKGYFLYEENSHRYADELIMSIRDTLPLHIQKPAPASFRRYGKNLFYATFRKNRHTSWYVFFTKHIDNDEIVYLVRYISNNHTTAHLV
jgi:hypothetical protein